ncbi:MAG TPA: replicative DNA helicase [Rugosimonospora sp.]|nr:replicative DNA helicase [Rugosimonospora sp.]
MSIADELRPGEQRLGEPPAASAPAGDPQYDRSPPQDIAAEQSVLGGMLLSKDAIADVVEVLRAGDFYRPNHATIFEAILDLYGRGEPADAVTVAAAMAGSGELGRVGGAGYLHTLMSSVPTAANAAYYARIVGERAVLRRLIEAGTRIVQLGYGTATGAGRDVDDLVDLAQQAVYDVTERRVSEDFAILSDLLQPTLDEIEAVGAQGGVMTGVPTGFSDLDRLLNGLHAGQLVIVAGRPGLGKALALDTPLPTAAGWTTMGEVKVGDRLIGADGRPTLVTATSNVMLGHACYEVEFSDGSVIVADADHLWRTTTRASRRQAAQARPSRYRAPESLERVRAAGTVALDGPDQLVTFNDALVTVGTEFRAVLHTVGRQIGVSGRLPRQYPRGNRQAPAYSRKALLSALLDRAARPMNFGNTARHDPIVTTEQIAATLRHPTDGRANHAVENCRPLELPECDLPIPPYTLGAWLGDGVSRAGQITTADPEILGFIVDDGFVVRPTRHPMHFGIHTPVRTCGRSCGGRSRSIEKLPPEGCVVCGEITDATGYASRRCARCHARYGSLVGPLREAGVFGDKHIPDLYLRSSQAQRRALLAGLLDTDGTVTRTGNIQYCSTSRRLAECVRELVVTLGYRCSVTTRKVRGRTPESSTAYTLSFTTGDEVFRLGRKRLAHAARSRTDARRTGSRYIVDVRPVASVPVRCVTVANDDHLYLAGRSMIPTHNSTAAMDFARTASVKHNFASAIFSLEMSKVEIVMRLLSAEARVPLHVLRSGQLSDDDWTKLARRMGEISEAPLFVDDTPNMNLMEIRAKARRLKQRHDLKLVVVDYLQLMSSPKRVESRQQEVAELSRGLKLLAKEIDCPVVAVSQLNRGPEQRNDKRPQLSDLRESGSIEQDADVVILLHRDDYYDKESPRAGEADFIVAKHRNGPTDTVTVAAQLHLSRFVDMALD